MPPTPPTRTPLPNKPPADLATPAQYLKGVGPDRAKLLERLGIRTAADVLFNFPRDYQDLTDLRAIDKLEEDKPQSIHGVVEEVDLRTTGPGRSILGVLVRDNQQYLRSLWFNMPFMADKFKRGQEVLLSGKPRLKGQRWEMAHPHVQWIDREEGDAPQGELLPVYPLTEGLKQGSMRHIARHALETYTALVEERFSPEYLAVHKLMPIQTALREIHFPTSHENLQLARRRFIYQEMLILQLGLALRRNLQITRELAPALPVTAQIAARITRLLPFELTPDQRQAVDEIAADMARTTPMNRLLQGDVGSGKTAVAVYAMLVAVAHGCQAALMAPTEVLARQHYRTLEKLLAGSRVRMALFSGGLSAREREDTEKKIAAGEIDIVIGTQAIVSGEATFKRLGLVVIDEQHRFGVRQRATLKQSGVDPHYLVMTATPIPRTVALTLFGDLDVSVIAASPPGRQPINTYSADGENRAKWWDFFRKHLQAGRQGYVIVPFVEEGEAADEGSAVDEIEDGDNAARAVPKRYPALDATFEELAHGELEAFRLGLVHGRMTSEEKDAALSEFATGRTQVLVATSVVEVGIDVPNATLMTILGADRFGMAQLHQMRGRIARGKYPGYCCVFADSPTTDAQERLQAFVSTTDGFKIADLDFQLRGPGELFGTRQHGLAPFYMADLVRDAQIVSEARQDAKQLVAADPGLAKSENMSLRRQVITRYGQALDLGDVG